MKSAWGSAPYCRQAVTAGLCNVEHRAVVGRAWHQFVRPLATMFSNQDTVSGQHQLRVAVAKSLYFEFATCS